MPNDNVILKFNKVSFEYGHTKPILHEVDFSVRRGLKFALMGQNGAGKSTLFSLITGVAVPESGSIAIEQGLSIALARQAIPADQMDITVKEFFEKLFTKKIYDIDPRIKEVLEIVHLPVSSDRKIRSLSGGQQARLLLASALIQKPDLLLLDEPTNNLDPEGLAHLTQFLVDYKKTCIVISHDADFLNAFTDGVLYLDVFTHTVEKYVGNYFNVVEEIAARIERERRQNVRLENEIMHRKEQASFFDQKGGHMRDVARKMKEAIAELEEEKVETREEDKTIRKFAIPCEENLEGPIITINAVSLMAHGKPSRQAQDKPVTKKVKIVLKQKNHLLLSGPNGIGKTTLLQDIASEKSSCATIAKGIRVGYYRQDFSTLDPEKTVYESLAEVMRDGTEETLRSTAAGFLLNAEDLKHKIKNISEGQKGLVMFTRLVLQRPGLLILDEPTNHINFRHLPVIAEALDKYAGAMILVSHVPSFVKKIRIDETLDLAALAKKEK
jgi:ATPase subunit of ABC transporter with duplicated ATPase domains